MKTQLTSLLKTKIYTRVFFVLIILAYILLFSIIFSQLHSQNGTQKKTVVILPIKEGTPIQIAEPVQVVKSTPTIVVPKLIFGVGPEADQAVNSRLVKEAPVKMLTSWYNGPSDLSWIIGWHDNLIPRLYSQGYILHLITFTEKPEGPLSTPHGPACGRAYPVSTQILSDMKKLATTFEGKGKLYVTLFTEFQTYPCDDNKWAGNENYYNTLKDNYREIKSIFHKYAPNSQVGISWGGWQSRWDDPGGGGGVSLFPHFADIMSESDITSFQAMDSSNNVEDIKNMTRILGTYGKPVILSHYKPDNRSQVTFDNDMKSMLTDSFLKNVTANGLVGMSFMDTDNMNNEESIYQLVKKAVLQYGR